jgi:hypothetical protein
LTRGGVDAAPAAAPEEEQVAMHGDKVRDWLKNLRDSGYQILGLVMSHVPSVFAMPGLAAAMLSALLGSMESMETRHLRAAIRVVLQVRSGRSNSRAGRFEACACPPQHRHQREQQQQHEQLAV